LEVLGRVAELPLPADHLGVLGREHEAVGEVVEVHQAAAQPLAVRVLVGEALLDLVVADDAALARVDEEHAPGLEAPLLHDRRLVDGQTPTSDAMITSPSSVTQ